MTLRVHGLESRPVRTTEALHYTDGILIKSVPQPGTERSLL